MSSLNEWSEQEYYTTRVSLCNKETWAIGSHHTAFQSITHRTPTRKLDAWRNIRYQRIQLQPWQQDKSTQICWAGYGYTVFPVMNIDEFTLVADDEVLSAGEIQIVFECLREDGEANKENEWPFNMVGRSKFLPDTVTVKRLKLTCVMHFFRAQYQHTW